jgi:hypothetical protein
MGIVRWIRLRVAWSGMEALKSMSDYLPPNRNTWPAPATHPRRDAACASIARALRDAEIEAERRAWAPYADEVDEWAEQARRGDDAASGD